MNITITLTEEDQSLQAEILRILLNGEGKEKAKEKEPQLTPKPTEQPTPKPYPKAGGEETPAPSDPSDSSDKAATPSDSSDKTTLSMADLRKSCLLYTSDAADE